MTAAIMDKYIAPKMPEITRTFEQLKREASDFIDKAQTVALGLDENFKVPRSRWLRLFLLGRNRTPIKTTTDTPIDRDLVKIAFWRTKAQSSESPLERACYQALVTTADAIFARRGRLPNDHKLITSIALRLVCNDYGSMIIGEALEPIFRFAARQESYRFLPAQSYPIVMNVKGASASGKSTMRPLQKQLALRLGVDWADFALISPDILRKYLLDYSSLGPARRYAGTLTGIEVAIIDQKLDRYMSYKGKVEQLPHLCNWPG
jgi:hypothetical protein